MKKSVWPKMAFAMLLTGISVFMAAAKAKASLACEEVYRSVEADFSEPGRYLRELEDYIQKNPNHELLGNPEARTLKIGLLRRNEREFARLAVRAIHEGSIQNIDAGDVISPKILALLSRLLQESNDNNMNLRIYGKLSPRRLHGDFQVKSARLANRNSTEHWFRHEMEDYENARKSLNLEQCKYTECKFEFRVENQEITLNYSEHKWTN